MTTVIDKEILKQDILHLDLWLARMNLEEPLDVRDLYNLVYTLGKLVQHLLKRVEPQQK